jgi:hypothetical protein
MSYRLIIRPEAEFDIQDAVRRFPYGILYVFDQNIISVIACFHGKRDPKSWEDRL